MSVNFRDLLHHNRHGDTKNYRTWQNELYLNGELMGVCDVI